jgi:hypothetical protein
MPRSASPSAPAPPRAAGEGALRPAGGRVRPVRRRAACARSGLARHEVEPVTRSVRTGQGRLRRPARVRAAGAWQTGHPRSPRPRGHEASARFGRPASPVRPSPPPPLTRMRAPRAARPERPRPATRAPSSRGDRTEPCPGKSGHPSGGRARAARCARCARCARGTRCDRAGGCGRGGRGSPHSLLPCGPRPARRVEDRIASRALRTGSPGTDARPVERLPRRAPASRHASQPIQGQRRAPPTRAAGSPSRTAMTARHAAGMPAGPSTPAARLPARCRTETARLTCPRRHPLRGHARRRVDVTPGHSSFRKYAPGRRPDPGPRRSREGAPGPGSDPLTCAPSAGSGSCRAAA